MVRWCRVVLLVLACSLALTPGVARADVVLPGGAPPVRVLSYNVCGASTCQYTGSASTWTNGVVAQVTAWDADVLLLQELCAGQSALLKAALAAKGYYAVFTGGAFQPSGCGHWGTDRHFGVGMFVRSATVTPFYSALTVPAGEQPRELLCARALLEARMTLVCDTHLAQYQVPDNGTREVLSIVDRWAGGIPVILGGDFNAQPTYPALQVLRDGVPGTGRFDEVDETDRDYFTADCVAAGVDACRSGQPTVGDGTPASPDKKFDHIMVTSRDFQSLRATVVEPGLSDHRMLVGAVALEQRAPSGVPGDLTGDGRPDLIAVQNEGNLRLYPGLGGGRVGPARQIGTGGWSGGLITHRGDWTGDGREDVLARIGDELRVYTNAGTGELVSRTLMNGHPTGWSGVRAIVAPGDVDGDGVPDLLVQSGASGLWWLHRGDADHRPGLLPAPTQVGGPELAGADLLPVGDVDGDNRADVWARDRASGALTLRTATAAGGLAAPRPAADGRWPASSRPLVATGGDTTGDGRPDLWVTSSVADGNALLFHPGTTQGLGAPTTIGTGGWQAIDQLS